VTVTAQQVTALRALLSRDPRYAELTGQLADGTQDGYGQLVIAAFTLAVRRRFAPAWQAADVIHYTAALRLRLRVSGVDLEPRPAEDLIQAALTGSPAPAYTSQTTAETLLLILADVVSDARVAPAGLDAFVAEARTRADTSRA
jgi:hypothetical protein